MLILLRSSILLILSVGLLACQSGTISRDGIAGTYTTALTDGALFEVNAPFMIATAFNNQELILELTSDGVYRFSQPVGSIIKIRSEGKYDLTPEQVIFKKDGGEFSCSLAGVDKGSYTWKLDGESLTFAVLEDQCDDRVYPMIALPWKRDH